MTRLSEEAIMKNILSKAGKTLKIVSAAELEAAT